MEAYHVTIDLSSDEGLAIEAVKDAMHRLSPASIQVDPGGPWGRPLLAALQASGLPATALEKRPRPTLPEVQRIEQLSKELEQCKAEREELHREGRILREHLGDLRTLIQRLE